MQVYCEISNISIDCDTECYIFILKPSKWESRLFDLAAFPILGKYDDWHRVYINSEEIDSENLKLIESYFNCELHELLDVICGIRGFKYYPNMIHTEEIEQLRIMYVRKDVYDYLSKEKFDGELYNENTKFFKRNNDIRRAIELFGIDYTEISLYEFHINDLKRGVSDNIMNKYSFDYFLKEHGLIANYMPIFNKFEKQIKELRILHLNMKYLSKTWTPYIPHITHQFQEHKIHKKILREFGRIMTKTLKESYK